MPRDMSIQSVLVIGSIYVRSASSGSVMIVAGLLLTSTTSTPSLRSALHACEPE